MSSATYNKLEYAGQGPLEEGAEPARRRNYDMCMIFKYKVNRHVRFVERDEEDAVLATRGLREPTPKELAKMEAWKTRREAILKTLQNCGLDLYCFYSRDRDNIIVKIGAGAQKLRDTAARMKYKLQLKAQYLSAYAEYRHDVQGRPERQFKDRRVVSHFYKTYTEDDFLDSDAIFKTIDKIHLIHHIITSTDKDCAGVNLAELMQGDFESLNNKQVKDDALLIAYFPLHENKQLDHMNNNKLNWFVMGEEHAIQLRDYFGEKVAFYFLFLGFYIKWLIPVAVLGVVLQFIDFVVQTPDNTTMVPFCILMSVWSTFMPYFWRRQEAKYAISWGTLDLVETLEPCRPEHTGERMINPVTAQVEPHYPFKKRIYDYIFSASIMVITLVLLVFSLGVLILCRHLYRADMGILFFCLVTAAYCELANEILTKIGRVLTDRENHRTLSEHETHLLSKVMCFKFINSYAVLFYIVFMKHHGHLFGVQMDCKDCLLDMEGQLAVFVIFRLVVSNVFEFFLPRVKLWWRSCLYNDARYLREQLKFTHLQSSDLSVPETQSKKERFDNFSNFDEILITHGYMSLFAMASPWICFATLISVMVEIYLDMKGLIENRQRPRPVRSKTNEPWTTALDIYGCIGAFTNGLILIFGSSEYASWTVSEKLALFIVLEHAIFAARLILRLCLPDVPKNVETLKLKQDMMVHRCLENVKVEQNQDFSKLIDQQLETIEVFEQDIWEEEDTPDDGQWNLTTSVESLQKGVTEEVEVTKTLIFGTNGA